MAGHLLGPRNLSRALARWLVVAGVVLGLSQPRDLVWCHSDSGHSALEDLDARCCKTPAGEASCAEEVAGPRSGGLDGLGRSGGAPCTDVLVEAPTRLPVDKRLEKPTAEKAAVRLPAASEKVSPPRTSVLTRDGEDVARAAAHEVTLSNVLRI